MAKKTYSLYANLDSYQPKENDRLIIETGDAHVAFVVRSRAGNIIAVEWFVPNKEDETQFDNFFTEITAESDLLKQPYNSYDLFINSPQNVLIPAAVFDKENFNDHLNFAMGETIHLTGNFDEVNGMGNQVVNAYRYRAEVVQFLQSKFEFRTVRHSYSTFLQKWAAVKNHPAQAMHVIFYDDVFVVAFFAEGTLQLMRSFAWQSPEDVVYYLLQITNPLQVSSESLVISVSGFIQVHSEVYKRLTKYFKNVVIEAVNLGKVNLQSDTYPLHFFTPLFNLAL